MLQAVCACASCVRACGHAGNEKAVNLVPGVLNWEQTVQA